MEQRYAKVVLILTVGWFLGYMHHHVATYYQVENLRNENMALNARIVELRVHPPIKVKVKTTAYSNDKYSINVEEWRDGRTATNKVARRGYIAADWGVFPPGTKFYIPGYGEGIVEDKGGKVKGKHLDLFVNSRAEALRWGVRHQEVYVLELGQQEVNLSASLKSPPKDVELAQRNPTQDKPVKASF
jgi:3D (Asp-Asp-Asp) domain-containing protein